MRRELILQSPELQLISRWHEWLDLQVRAGGMSRATQETYQRGMDKFIAWLRSTPAPMTGETVPMWIAFNLDAGCKPTTCNVWLAGVRSFFSWAAGEGLIPTNPVASVKSVKRKNSSKHHLRDPLEDEEVIRVLAQPDKSSDLGRRDCVILMLYAYTGMRTIELYRANLDDLDTANGKPILRVQGKGYSEASDLVVLYHPGLQEAIYNWLTVRGSRPGALFTSLSPRSRGNRLGLAQYRRIVKEYYKLAGVTSPKKTTHSLRHAVISKVAKQDIL